MKLAAFAILYSLSNHWRLENSHSEPVRTAAQLSMGAGRDNTIHAAEILAQPCYPKSLNSGAPRGLKTGKTRQNVSYSYSSEYVLTEGHHQQHWVKARPVSRPFTVKTEMVLTVKALENLTAPSSTWKRGSARELEREFLQGHGDEKGEWLETESRLKLDIR